MAGELEKFFFENKGRVIAKWHHYFDIYERYFEKYRDKEVIILEIGVSHGGSVQMWKNYFGSKAKIYGIDINPNCKQIEEENIHIFIGSQEDREFLRKVKSEIPKLDILIDDGGHTMKQQIVSFEELFDHIKEDGIYLCEDNHTSYWKEYGGGFQKKRSFIEYTKNWIDKMHAWYSETAALKVDDFTKSIFSICYYDSIVVIEKKPKTAPVQTRQGSVLIPNRDVKLTFLEKVISKIQYEYNKLKS
jgi:hypothetical protein